jgi:fatty-acyl-CoA synthase
MSVDLLGEQARRTPGKTALVYIPTGKRYTYAELDAGSCAMAQHWLGLGLKDGDRVCILAEPRPDYVQAFFATGKSGVVLVPLNSRNTARELAEIVKDCAPSAILYSERYERTVGEILALAPVENAIGIEERRLEAGGTAGWKPALQDVSSSKPPSRRLEASAPEDLCCLLYTSGTTGKPKGVMIPHRQVAANARNTVLNWELREDDVAPIFTPLYHAGGLFVFLAPLISIGGTIVLHSRFDASEVWSAVERERATIVFGVPTIFKMMMDAPEFGSVRLDSVRWMISGGAPLPQYIISAYQERGITFKQGYGLTEVGVNCFTMTAEESRRKTGSIGKPMVNTEVRLMNADGGETGIEEVGEMWLRGDHVCCGYWNNPAATAAALDAEGWFHTGDLARRDADGFFYIAGRLKDMIISGGVNIYPAEIEAVLVQHPAVADAALVGVTDEKWGEVGVAFVVAREQVNAADVIEFLASRLARYKLPKEVVFLPELPRTAYGKVVKGELRERWAER